MKDLETVKNEIVQRLRDLDITCQNCGVGQTITVNRDAMVNGAPASAEHDSYDLVLTFVRDSLPPGYRATWFGKSDDDLYLDITQIQAGTNGTAQ